LFLSLSTLDLTPFLKEDTSAFIFCNCHPLW
jgi:hypothetical protein